MKFTGLSGAIILLSACSLALVPGGSAQSAASEAQQGEWTQGAVPNASAPAIAMQPAVTPELSETTRLSTAVIQPIDPAQLIKLGSDQTRAIGAGVALGPTIASLKLQDSRATAALRSYRTSCISLSRREDQSGLTQGSDWQTSCDSAQNWAENNAGEFFVRYFEAVQVSDGKAHATGYFEPQILGSRVRNDEYQVPVYRRPTNLLDVDLGQFAEALKDKRIRGKIDGTKLVPFEDRGQIDDGALAGQGLEIAWAKDYIEFFFLQIQGSGRLLMPDGSVMRIGYGGQNGRDYTGIGRVMRARGLLADGKTNMQGIVEWLRANPVEGQKIMRENRSYIFFNELTGPGPLGAMGHPVVAHASVATDRMFVPLGAPVFLNMEHNIADGIWIAQDTGGAIKGSNRFDTFWGAGEEAAQIAGGMSSRGQALIFLPKGSVAKLAARAGQ